MEDQNIYSFKLEVDKEERVDKLLNEVISLNIQDLQFKNG